MNVGDICFWSPNNRARGFSFVKVQIYGVRNKGYLFDVLVLHDPLGLMEGKKRTAFHKQLCHCDDPNDILKEMLR